MGDLPICSTADFAGRADVVRARRLLVLTSELRFEAGLHVVGGEVGCALSVTTNRPSSVFNGGILVAERSRVIDYGALKAIVPPIPAGTEGPGTADPNSDRSGHRDAAL